MKRFLIAGCQRSGTTLMRLLLGSHSRVECIDELLSYQVLAGQRRVPDFDADLVGYKIPIWTEQLLQPVLHADELAFLPGMQQTPNFYDGEKIVFMTRNPFDTIASMLRLKIDGVPWIRRCEPLIARKRSEPSFAETFSRELAFADASADPTIVFAAIYWKVKALSLPTYLDAGLPITVVSYEQLVTAPEPLLRTVVSFLELDWEVALLNHHKLTHPQIVRGRAIGGTDPTRPIDAASIDQWEHDLSVPQIEVIQTIVGDAREDIRTYDAPRRQPAPPAKKTAPS